MNFESEIIRFITDDLLLGMNDTPVTPDVNLLTTGLVDSLGVMRLVMFIEEEFGINVPPEDVTIEHFLTVSDMVRYLESTKVVALS
ncbi:acyl carrier protein [Chloroflexi bacterium TSY]|nr:acyl carrier protein [Chloroflexi bacterium TSY]